MSNTWPLSKDKLGNACKNGRSYGRIFITVYSIVFRLDYFLYCNSKSGKRFLGQHSPSTI